MPEPGLAFLGNLLALPKTMAANEARAQQERQLFQSLAQPVTPGGPPILTPEQIQAMTPQPPHTPGWLQSPVAQGIGTVGQFIQAAAGSLPAPRPNTGAFGLLRLRNTAGRQAITDERSERFHNDTQANLEANRQDRESFHADSQANLAENRALRQQMHDDAMKKGAGSDAPGSPFKLWQRDNPRGSYDDYSRAVAQGAGERSQATQAVKDAALTNTTKTMVESAPTVAHFVDKINRDLDQIQTGPASSRYQEFMAGKVGAPNPDFMRYRTNVGLLTTLLLRMHVGARGGQQMLDHFRGLMDAGKQSPENMRAALDEIRSYAQDVATKGSGGTTVPNAETTPPPPQGGSPDRSGELDELLKNHGH